MQRYTHTVTTTNQVHGNAIQLTTWIQGNANDWLFIADDGTVSIIPQGVFNPPEYTVG